MFPECGTESSHKKTSSCSKSSCDLSKKSSHPKRFNLASLNETFLTVPYNRLWAKAGLKRPATECEQPGASWCKLSDPISTSGLCTPPLPSCTLRYSYLTFCIDSQHSRLLSVTSVTCKYNEVLESSARFAGHSERK